MLFQVTNNMNSYEFPGYKYFLMSSYDFLRLQLVTDALRIHSECPSWNPKRDLRVMDVLICPYIVLPFPIYSYVSP